MTGRRPGAVLPAKLTVPKVDRAVSRSRLFKILDDACEAPVVWVGAPAGSGKTTLVASYLARRKIKPLWYQCDARDADPGTFFAYMRLAAGKLAPRKRETLPLLTPEYIQGLPAFTLNFFEQLFSRLRPPAVLVFDNYQELPDTSPVQALWQSFLSVLPEGVTLIFVSRTAPPENFVPLRASVQLKQIGAEVLRIDSDEAQLIGERVAAVGFTAEQIVDCNEKAGGWAAGLVLLLQNGGLELEAKRGADTELFDYFAAEIMRRTDEETRTFLMKCALLPVMNAASTAALTGNFDAEYILKGLVKRNCFITRLPGDVMRYEFHPLFRHYLLEALRHGYGASVPELKRKAGHILVEQKEYDAAVELLAQSGDTEALAMLVLTHAEKLIAEGRYQTLTRWLQVIPDEAYEQQPWLMYWRGVCNAPSHMALAKGCYETAYAAFVARGDVAGTYMSWAGVADALINLLDNFYELDQWVDALERHIAGYGQPEASLLNHIAPRMYGALMVCRPQYPQLQQWKDAALTAFDAEENLSLKLLGGFYLSVTAIWGADFAEAKAMLLRLRQIGEVNDTIPAARIVRELFESWLNWLSGEAVLAQNAAEAGIAIGKQSGARLWEPLMIMEAMVSSITAGDLDRAAGFSAQLKPMLPHVRRWDRAYYFHENGWLAALNGDCTEGLRLQMEAHRLMLELGGAIPLAEILIGLAQAYTLNGKFKERDEVLGEAVKIAEWSQSPLVIFSSTFVAAAYALDDGNVDRAKGLVGKAMHIGSRQGYRNFTWWLPQQAARLCSFALGEGIESGYVRELIRVRRLAPPDDLHPSLVWPWPVKIYAMGGFLLRLEDKSPVPGGKGQGRVTEMLKLLVTLGGRQVSEQRISDLLWPDADGDQARQNFKVTLHRLRKVVGKESLLFREGQLSLNPQWVWVDVWALARALLLPIPVRRSATTSRQDSQRM